MNNIKLLVKNPLVYQDQRFCLLCNIYENTGNKIILPSILKIIQFYNNQLIQGSAQAEYPFEPVVDPALLNGTFPIAVTPFGQVFGIFEDELRALCLGASGSTKTNTTSVVINSIMKIAPNVILIIFAYNKDYRSFYKLNKRTIVLTVSKARYNPMNTYGAIDIRTYMNAHADIFSDVFNIWVGSKSLLVNAMDDLYRDYGVYVGSGNCPSMFDLYDKIKSIKAGYGRLADYLTGLKVKLEGILLEFGDFLDCSSGINWPALFSEKCPIVIEVPPVGREFRAYFVSHILYYIYLFQRQNKNA